MKSAELPFTSGSAARTPGAGLPAANDPSPAAAPVPGATLGAPPAGGPASSEARIDTDAVLERVRSRLGDMAGPNGEVLADHSRGVVGILTELHADPSARIAGALVSTGGRFGLDEIERLFGREVRDLVDLTRQVERLREIHRRVDNGTDGTQLEVLRRMMLAMSSDIRVVLIRLASRLQTLRYFAAAKRTPDPALSAESLEVLAPLANRLGLWQLKWEIEDLSFRFLEPQTYRLIARQLDDKRREREQLVAEAIERLRRVLGEARIEAEVSGRPKHIYSIHSKMRAKGLPLDGIRDLHGLRVIVSDVQRCYEALSLIHQMWPPVPGEYDDYISRPKANGYQSLHTVVSTENGRPLEVQIRTRDMHHHAEYGVASHWVYKEKSTGVSGAKGLHAGESERLAWLRQLLAWQRDVGVALGGGSARRIKSGGELIYVLTPQGKVVELPEGSTPIDFAYHVHTDLGHRCRGARVDGQLVSLNTSLHNGQTVEILSVRKGSGNDGPSRDWLNPELGYVRSSRARTKLRQWFNARELEHDMAVGRERIEKIMQREGKTGLAMPELASRLGLGSPDALFAAVGREDIGLRMIEDAVRGSAPPPPAQDQIVVTRPTAPVGASARDGGVLVVGVDLLMTQLARCCRPVPPDPIIGFVTRGRGVSVHRIGCKTFERMRATSPERVIETDWGAPRGNDRQRRYPVEVLVQAVDRAGLLRDISEVFARDRLNVVAVNTLTRGQLARMQFTVEVSDAGALQKALGSVGEVPGVYDARRRAI
ncbi:MAG: bifunctional (p)ppGpp synthetase/guanosine-3',5'-bis(diphosphate) 3'-pyrophosphohydrolase [Burkholderiaceae bacterium]